MLARLACSSGLRAQMKPASPTRHSMPGLAAAGLVALLAAACGEAGRTGGGEAASASASAAAGADPAAWRRAPRVREVVATPAGWAVRGEAAPRARVALGIGADAFAASADARGAFEIIVPPAVQARRLSLQTRQGQAVARAPAVLLLPPAGLAAPPLLAAPGQASRVFADARLLEAVDADADPLGRIVSGTAGTDAEVGLEPGARTLIADAAGRWTGAAPGEGPVTVRGEGRAVTVTPGFPVLEPGRDARIEAIGAGWGYAWRLPDGLVRAAWVPATPRRTDAPAPGP
jgi:hypothetical protein